MEDRVEGRGNSLVQQASRRNACTTNQQSGESIMEMKETIEQRRAVRDYTDQPIEKATVLALLHAAIQAPSAMNLQPWAFAVIQDKDWLKRHSDRAKVLVIKGGEFAQKRAELKAMLADPEFNIFYNAGTLVVICARPI